MWRHFHRILCGLISTDCFTTLIVKTEIYGSNNEKFCIAITNITKLHFILMFSVYLSDMLPLTTLLSSKVRRTLASKIKAMLYCDPFHFHDTNVMLKKNSAIGKVTEIPVKSININSKSITTVSLQHDAKSCRIWEHGERRNHFIYSIKGKKIGLCNRWRL